MKRIALWAVIGVGLLLAGCIVPSVYPFYTQNDLTYDAALLGTWADIDSQPNDNKIWIFEQGTTLEYKFKMTDKDSTNEFSAHLFKLKDDLFLDCQLKQPQIDAIPAHYLLRIQQIQPTLKFTTLNSDWLRDYLAKNPATIRHTLTADDPADTNTIHVVLTADTKDLQKFILKNLNNTNAFYSVGEKKKL